MKAGAKNENLLHVNQIIVKCLIAMTMGSCFQCAPFSSDLQSARMAGKGSVEVTPEYSSIQFAEQERPLEKGGVQKSTGTLKGIQVAYGLSEKLDLRVRAEHFEFRNISIYVFSVGTKISLIKDRVALYLPIWFVDLKPAAFQPTILLTFPVVKNKIEFNPSVKNIISLGGYDPNSTILVGLNAGLGISTNLSKWALRPEYSLVYDVKERAQFKSFSIGLSLNMSLLLRK